MNVHIKQIENGTHEDHRGYEFYDVQKLPLCH